MARGTGGVSRTMVMALAIACAALGAGLAVYVLNSSMALLPFDQRGELDLSGVVFKVLSAPLVTLWCYSACRRCTDGSVRRYLVGICGLCLFWILDTLVKYPARIDWLVQLLWYLFYIPIIFIPLLCAWVAFYLWKGGNGRTLRVFQRVSFAVSAALLALVLTNGMHHLVFIFDYGSSSWGSAYVYGPGYWLVVGWICALVVFCPVALVMVARRGLRRAIGFMLVPLGIIGLYAALYALRVPIVYTSSVAVMYTIFIVATFEVGLRMGLAPVQQHQLEVFERLPFELEVFDDEGELCYRTELAAGDAGFGGARAHVRYERSPLSTGYAVTAKDTALVEERSRELRETRDQLERQHALLEREYGIDARMRVQQELESLYDEVASSLRRALERAARLLARASEPSGEGAHGARWGLIAEAKLLLGLCKQNGQCIVDARQQAAFSGDYLRLGMAEASANMRALGIECGVLLEADGLSAQALCLLYGKLYAWGISVLGDAEPVIVARVSAEAGAPHVRIMVECDDAESSLSRERELSRVLGERSADTVWVLGETELSASALLSERADADAHADADAVGGA